MTELEYRKLEDYLAAETVKRLGISDRAARLRVRALHRSGILTKFGAPSTLEFKVAIDAAMQIPQISIETEPLD